MIPIIILTLLPLSSPIIDTKIIIAGPNEIKISYQNNLTEDDIYRKFKIPSKHLIKDHYFDSNLILNYPHTSNHILYLIDKENNIYQHNFTLNIIDDISPLIYGPDILEFDYKLLPSTEELLQYYTSYDEIDLYLQLEIDLQLEDIITKPGKYVFNLSSQDYSCNFISKPISLNITSLDKEPYHIKRITKRTMINHYVSPEDMMKELISRNLIENKKYEKCHYISDEYSSNYNKEGVYMSTLELTHSYHTIKINIKFLNEKEALNDKTSLISSIVNFFKKIFNLISQLISNFI